MAKVCNKYSQIYKRGEESKRDRGRWEEHFLEATEEAVQEVLQESLDGEGNGLDREREEKNDGLIDGQKEKRAEVPMPCARLDKYL